MRAKINIIWRLFATAFSFFIFGLGGIAIAIVIVPILHILPGSRLKKERRGQKFVHYVFASFIELLRLLGILTYDVHNLQQLRQSKFVLANHPTLLDVVFLIGLIPNANCIVKGALLNNPALRWSMKAAGYTMNNGSANDLLEATQAVFKKGQIMIVFPEGTRSIPNKRLTLKRGAANIAIRSGVDITPVIISCVPISLTKQDRWYQVPKKPMHFTIKTMPVIELRDYEKLNNTRGARALTEYLTEYFNAEVSVNDSVAQ